MCFQCVSVPVPEQKGVVALAVGRPDLYRRAVLRHPHDLLERVDRRARLLQVLEGVARIDVLDAAVGKRQRVALDVEHQVRHRRRLDVDTEEARALVHAAAELDSGHLGHSR